MIQIITRNYYVEKDEIGQLVEQHPLVVGIAIGSAGAENSHRTHIVFLQIGVFAQVDQLRWESVDHERLKEVTLSFIDNDQSLKITIKIIKNPNSDLMNGVEEVLIGEL